MSKKNKKLSVFEIVWYSICGAIGVWGLTYTVLGLIAENISLNPANNPLLIASKSIENAFGLGFFGWGLILVSIATVAAVIVLLSNAKVADREYEKAQRRAARLNRNKVVEAEVKEGDK